MESSDKKVAAVTTAHEDYHDFVGRYRAAEFVYDEACADVLELASTWERNPVRSTADALRAAVCAWRAAGNAFVSIRNEGEKASP